MDVQADASTEDLPSMAMLVQSLLVVAIIRTTIVSIERLFSTPEPTYHTIIAISHLLDISPSSAPVIAISNTPWHLRSLAAGAL